MSNIEKLARLIYATGNADKIMAAITLAAEASTAGVMLEVHPAKSSKPRNIPAREEFNKMINSSRDPKMTYNVLAALTISETQKMQSNQ